MTNTAAARILRSDNVVEFNAKSEANARRYAEHVLCLNREPGCTYELEVAIDGFWVSRGSL